ncbi:P-loop NTPase fold protein [Erwinia sp. 198]|uniref:P-loop NTPase fold protein n=1 Tax=Erwinia sp. 198 TaxID=2022746 RepID=UPI000F659621|nr:P-loop NTPase fold protein [Erwinia sp. 198]RRZ96857.1 hypothetical protein EGK14_00715 [Erwinia sp. 198]
MNLNIYTDEPAKKDVFEGKAHENLALKLAVIAQSDEISIIGLDGYLGSGKSTIIDMAMEKIQNDDIHIIKFDSEIYHYGATKKALIDILYDGFKKTPEVNHENLSQCKDYALGNIYNYKRNVNSKISLWTLIFICTSVICLQTLRFLITDFSSLFTSRPLPYSQYIKVFLEFLLVISPVLVGCLYTRNKKEILDNGKVTLSKPSFGDILKRNSEDTITEKIIINKEVGTLELKSALEGFINCTPEKARIILIIDNLDRISPSKIKEIWSDIELITEIAGSKLKILIPYSGKHVAKALSEDEKEGLEFISKRIPVTLFVPPLISAGWRNGFLSFWEDSLGELNNEECYEVCELIERWLPKNYSSVTPRFMKRIINDIKLTSLTSPSFPLHRILIAFYILMVRYSLFDFKILISSYDNIEKKEGDTLDIERMKASHKQFNRLFNSEDEWKKGLICIHFQTNSEFAVSELIDEPLENSIRYREVNEFVKLSSMYGFDKAWKKSLHHVSIEEIIHFVDSLSSQDLIISNKILPAVIARFNKDNPLNKEYNEGLVRALVRIDNKIPFNRNEAFLSNHMGNLKKEVSNSEEVMRKDTKPILHLFEEVDLFLAITKEKFTECFPPVSGEIFFRFLLDQEGKYPNINICDISLDIEKIVLGMRYAIENGLNFNLFSPQIIEEMKVDDEYFEEFIKEDVSPYIENIYSNLKISNAIDSIFDFRKLALDSRWRSSNLSLYFLQQSNMLSQNPSEYYASFIAHKIASGDKSPIANISDVEVTDDFTNTLYNYLHFVADLDTIASSLSNENIKEIISPAVKKLITNGKVSRINTYEFIRNLYNPIRELLGRDNALLFFSAWDEHADAALSNKNHEKISEDFICDLSSRKDFPIFKNAIKKLVANNLSSKEMIYSYIRQPHIVYREMLGLLSNDGVKIDVSVDVRAFSDFYIEEDIKSINKEVYIEDIIPILHEETLNEIVKALMDLLERKDLDPKRQIFAIRDFGNLLNYDVNSSRNDNRAIAKLFSYAKEYEFLAKWLDNQKYYFSKWSGEDKKTVEAFVLNNRNSFPNLIKSKYFKNRVSNHNIEIDKN